MDEGIRQIVASDLHPKAEISHIHPISAQQTTPAIRRCQRSPASHSRIALTADALRLLRPIGHFCDVRFDWRSIIQ